LAYSPDQHPIVLQIGGSNLENLAKATELADAYGYDEINFKLVCFFLNILSIKMSLLF
jgi:tRNA-dihydrouridine synthase A